MTDGRGNDAPPVSRTVRKMAAKDNVRSQFGALGEFIRTQRHLANLSLREDQTKALLSGSRSSVPATRPARCWGCPSPVSRPW